MLALTLHQPWARCVSHHGKNVENRGWSPPQRAIGQRIAIHASRRFDGDGMGWVLASPDNLAVSLPLTEGEFVRGAVVATAVLAGWAAREEFAELPVVTHSTSIDRALAFRVVESPWYMGPYGWLLEQVVQLLRPVPCRGLQRLWALPPDVECEVVGQIGIRMEAEEE